MFSRKNKPARSLTIAMASAAPAPRAASSRLGRSPRSDRFRGPRDRPGRTDGARGKAARRSERSGPGRPPAKGLPDGRLRRPLRRAGRNCIPLRAGGAALRATGAAAADDSSASAAAKACVATSAGCRAASSATARKTRAPASGASARAAGIASTIAGGGLASCPAPAWTVRGFGADARRCAPRCSAGRRHKPASTCPAAAISSPR